MDCNWKKQNGHYFLEGLDKDVLMAFSTRKFYPGFKEDLDYMVRERQEFLKGLNLDIKNLVCPIQKHSVESFQVTASDFGKGAFDFDETLENIDILLTNEKGAILAVLSADCLPLSIYDPVNKSIAIAHIGWRGLAQGAPEAVIEKLNVAFYSQAEELILGIGPTIRSCCYEVNAPVVNYFKSYLKKRDAKNYLDLAEIVKLQLNRLGISEQNIFDCGICTSCKNDEFFSYRKEAQEADRIISIITLK